MSYKHLSITERELLLIHSVQGLSLCQIAKLLGRNKSTISRELARNGGEYLPSKAQARYKRRRKKCRPHKLLENPELFALVRKLFLERHWSPEQKRSTGNKGARRKLRHRGKPRRPKGYVLRGQPLHTITPDRGREFQLHGKVTTELGVEFYFPPPHQAMATRHQREYQRLVTRVFS